MISAPTTERVVVDIPDGLEVDGLPVLLDSGAMLTRFNQGRPADAKAMTSCRITNLRFKTQTSCTVSYALGRTRSGNEEVVSLYVRAFSRADYPDARRRSMQSRWVADADGLTVQPLDELCAIIYWFPNDERLDGLRRVVMPKKLQRLLHQHLTEYSRDVWRISDRSIRLQVMRYKPERRAVLRCRFRAHRHDDSDRHERFVYLGLYEAERLTQLKSIMDNVCVAAAGATHWTAPALLGVEPDDGLMITAELPGSPLRDSLNADESYGAVISDAAAAIAELHDTVASSFPAGPAIKDQIQNTYDLLGRLTPAFLPQARQLWSRLRESGDQLSISSSALVHGDLHPGQLLLGPSSVGIVDFDRAHQGDPMEDIGNFCAQLWIGPSGGRQWDANKATSSFLAAYERTSKADLASSSLSFWTALALFRSSLVPLGRMEPYWRQRTHVILDEALRILG